MCDGRLSSGLSRACSVCLVNGGKEDVPVWVWARIGIIALLLVSSVLLAGSVRAVNRGRPFRIGALTTSWGPTPQVVGLRDGLVELGYREDADFVIGVRFTQGELDAIPIAVRQLLQYGVDLLFISEDPVVRVAQKATKQVPIVFAAVSDPVGLGLIESYAHPGGNTTGVADLARSLGAKRLQLFLELHPGLKRVLFLYNGDDPYTGDEAEIYRDAAQHLGIDLVEKGVRTAEEARAFLSSIRQAGVDGILAPRCCSLNIPGLVLEVTTRQEIPTMFENAFWVDRGGLASYGADYYASGKQAARLVDKIFKGTKPGGIPVEVNPKIEFAVNLKTVNTLGLTIDPEVLYRADRVVR